MKFCKTDFILNFMFVLEKKNYHTFKKIQIRFTLRSNKLHENVPIEKFTLNFFC